mgnify:CR=1 FL=1
MRFDWPVPAVPLAFVDVPDGYERSDGSSQTNPVEAQKVVNIVKKLAAGHDVIFGEIGIVTPYSAQVRARRAGRGGVWGEGAAMGKAPKRLAAPTLPAPATKKAAYAAFSRGPAGGKASSSPMA